MSAAKTEHEIETVIRLAQEAMGWHPRTEGETRYPQFHIWNMLGPHLMVQRSAQVDDRIWDPLRLAGDALELAVKLQIHVIPLEDGERILAGANRHPATQYYVDEELGRADVDYDHYSVADSAVAAISTVALKILDAK